MGNNCSTTNTLPSFSVAGDLCTQESPAKKVTLSSSSVGNETCVVFAGCVLRFAFCVCVWYLLYVVFSGFELGYLFG
jgi:hypothetical protein